MFFLVIVLFVLDFIWLTFNKSNYDLWVGHVITIQLWPTILAYILLIASIYWILIPLVYQNPQDGFITGAKIGLVIYGIYNTTNMAIYPTYNIQMAIVDTTWGIFLFGILGYLCAKRINGKI